MKIKLFIIPIVMMTLLASCSYFQQDPYANIDPATNVALPAIFSDHMVLQRDIPVSIWGNADQKGKIIVTFQNKIYRTVVSDSGSWKIQLPAMSAGGPYTLSIIGAETIEFKDILIGDVWICSGQSNMEFQVKSANNAQEEIENANYPKIRLFTVAKNTSLFPQKDVTTDGWKICAPENTGNFSAVGYFFGREIHKKTDIPIGLIHSSWGGTIVEAWTSAKSLVNHPDFKEIINKQNAELSNISDSLYKAKTIPYQDQIAAWINKLAQSDFGSQKGDASWTNPDLDMQDWQIIYQPSTWEISGLPGYDGFVWFKKDVVFKPAPEIFNHKLHLGPIDDFDVTWFNGEKIGATNNYNEPRVYTIPAHLIKEGKNNITIRVLDTGGPGGIWGKPEDLFITNGEGDTITLAGDWYYRPSVGSNGSIVNIPSPKQLQDTPTFLYNAMIAPLTPYKIKGAIWYQGESNASRAYQYRSLFPLMIQDWRMHWHQGDFPFYFVQLANYMQSKSMPADDEWAELREAQTLTLKEPNAGMAVIIDVGDASDIHPKNKQDVGKRLALWALAKDYGQNITYSGPLYKSMKIEGNKIRLYFDHVNNGLIAKNGENLKGFAIAGEDKKFVWAKAEIDGETIIVSHPGIKAPKAVRYGWAANPVCNLYNKANLPASPFRTDDWRLITRDSK